MQTSYNDVPEVGLPGTLVSAGKRPTIIRRFASGTVRPGQYVVLVGENDCAHPSAAPTEFTRGGVALRNPYMGEDGVYPDNAPVDVVIEGDMWVTAESAVTALSAAFVRHVAAGAEELGAFRVDADGTDAAAVKGLRYMSAGTLVHLEVRQSAA